MFCSNCGAKLNDGAKFCSSCGAAVAAADLNAPAQPTYTPPAVSETPYAPPVQEEPVQAEPYTPPVQPEAPANPYTPPAAAGVSGNPHQQNPPAGAYTPPAAPGPETPYAPYSPYQTPDQPAQEQFPMKWYKFTIYFQLFANAVLNLFNALSSFLGLSYGEDADLVYASYRGLRGLDILMGVVYLALAAFALYTRFQLAKFKRNGPLTLYIFLLCNLAALIFYVVAASIATGLNLLGSTIISNAVTLAVVLVLDYIYFNKRKSLFVN